MYSFFIMSMLLSLALLMLFFMMSKSEKWDSLIYTTFECGFSSYFFSRFSFSIHFFMVGLIFLFMDLEICLMMPFMMDFYDNMFLVLLMMTFIFFLLMGVILEWMECNIDWKD